MLTIITLMESRQTGAGLIINVALKPNGAPKPHRARKPATSDDSSLARRREARDRDEALIEAMRRDSDVSTGELAAAIGKSRTICISPLRRLNDAGMAESFDRNWKTG